MLITDGQNWQKNMGLEPGALVRLSTDSKRYEGLAVVKESNLRCITVAYPVDSPDITLRILKGLISTAEDITHIHITEAIDDGPAVVRDTGYRIPDTGFKEITAIIDEPGGHDK